MYLNVFNFISFRHDANQEVSSLLFQISKYVFCSYIIKQQISYTAMSKLHCYDKDKYCKTENGGFQYWYY